MFYTGKVDGTTKLTCDTYRRNVEIFKLLVWLLLSLNKLLLIWSQFA